MRQILIVANRTLGGQEMLSTVRERLDAGPSEFWVVVPATVPTDAHDLALLGPGGTVGGSLVEAPPHAEDPYAAAERRLEQGLAALRQLGATVDGEVGDEDPMHAIEHALTRRQFDEIVISTMPTHLSHWLHTDLPSRVHRKFHIQTTTVTGQEPGPH